MKKDTRRTLIIFLAGLLLAALGFFFLRKDSITAAPILIISGYLLMALSLIPFEPKKRKGN